MNISQITNEPINVQIGDLKTKVRQLTLSELYSYFEQKIKSTKIEDARQIGESLNPEERIDFSFKIWASLPYGSELTLLADELKTSFEGIKDCIYLSCKDYSDISMEDINKVITNDSIRELIPIYRYVTGIDDCIKTVEELEDDVEIKKDDDSKKN